MLTNNPVRRARLLIAAAVITASLGAPGTAAAAVGEGPDFDVKACVKDNGRLVLTATWHRMRVTDWSWFVESPEGSGGTSQPVPVPGSSGKVTKTFAGRDPSDLDSVRASLARTPGTSVVDLASMTLFQPDAGWHACSAGVAGPDFDVKACVKDNGRLVLIATWHRMRVTDWSWFVESSEGSGGTSQPVPSPGSSGKLTKTFAGLDPSLIDSVRASVMRTPGTSVVDLASMTLFQPDAGWPSC